MGLLDISAHTLRTWGEAQIVRYLVSGRSCNNIRPGLYRREQGKHVIFFRREHEGILVLRILHERMLPERHCFADQDESR